MQPSASWSWARASSAARPGSPRSSWCFSWPVPGSPPIERGSRSSSRRSPHNASWGRRDPRGRRSRHARRLHALDRKRTPLRPSGDRGRILYLSHNGLTEPLGRRQVLPYVVGLSSRNFELTVVSFEKAETAVPEAVARVKDVATAARVRWKPLRYHTLPWLVGMVVDIVQGLAVCLRLARHNDLIHARSTVPAFIARLTSKSRASRGSSTCVVCWRRSTSMPATGVRMAG